MAEGYYRELTKLLIRAGYAHRGNFKGSHEKWVHPALPTLCVPCNLYSRHTANGILKSAGLSHRF